MYKVHQTYTLVHGRWLPGSCFTREIDTGKTSCRSYGGAFYDNGAKRERVEWESEHFPTYDDILAKAPGPTISQAEIDCIEEERRKTWTAQKKQPKETKLFPKVFIAILLQALFAGFLLWVFKR